MHSLPILKVPTEVNNIIQAIVDILLDRFVLNIHKIILFGSYATGKYQPDSDIDILVVLNVLPELKDRRLYKQAIDNDNDVDLLFCTKEQFAGGDFVYKRINEHGVVLYEQL